MVTLPLGPEFCYNEAAHASRWYLYGLMTGLGVWVGFPTMGLVRSFVFTVHTSVRRGVFHDKCSGNWCPMG